MSAGSTTNPRPVWCVWCVVCMVCVVCGCLVVFEVVPSVLWLGCPTVYLGCCEQSGVLVQDVRVEYYHRM